MKFSVSYIHITNGLVERSFRTLVGIINCYPEKSNSKDWCRLVGPACYAYNATPHVGLGVSPMEALFGVKPRLMIDVPLFPTPSQPLEVQDRLRWLEEVRIILKKNLEKSQVTQANNFAKRHRIITFEPGEKVLIYDPAKKVGVTEKMRKKWEKEGVVEAKINDGLYMVRSNGVSQQFQIDRLKKFYEGGKE